MRTGTAVSILGILTLASGATRLATAEWISDGNPVCTAPGQQLGAQCLPDGSGNVLVVWTDDRPVSPGVYLRRLLANGDPAPGMPADGKRLIHARDCRVAPDGEGGLLLASSIYTGQGILIHVHRRDAQGDVAPGWPDTGVVVASISFYGKPSSLSLGSISADGQGGADVSVVYAYNDYDPACSCFRPTFYPNARHVDGDTRAVSSFMSTHGVSLMQSPPDGILTYAPANGTELACKRYTRDGALAWDRHIPTTATGNGTSEVTDGAGGMIALWSRRGDGVRGIYAIRQDRNGDLPAGWSPGGNLISGSIADPGLLRAVADGAGGAIVLWWDPGSDQSYAQRIGADGAPVAGWPAGGLPVPSFAQELIADGEGGAIGVFQSNEDLFAHRMTSAGSLDPLWGPGRVVTAAAGRQSEPSAILDGAGSAFVAWDDYRGVDPDIYATRVSNQSPTPTLIAAFEARFVGAAVHVLWRFSDPDDVTDVRLDRSPAANGPWKELRADVRGDGDGFAVVDASALPGTSYYRLRVQSRSGASSIFGPISVVASGPAGFGVVSVRPNPSLGTLQIDFVLPEAGPVDLSIIDLQGRLVARIPYHSESPGMHHVAWNGKLDGIEPGVYFVRGRQAGKISTVPIVVAR